MIAMPNCFKKPSCCTEWTLLNVVYLLDWLWNPHFSPVVHRWIYLWPPCQTVCRLVAYQLSWYYYVHQELVFQIQLLMAFLTYTFRRWWMPNTARPVSGWHAVRKSERWIPVHPPWTLLPILRPQQPTLLPWPFLSWRVLPWQIAWISWNIHP